MNLRSTIVLLGLAAGPALSAQAAPPPAPAPVPATPAPHAAVIVAQLPPGQDAKELVGIIQKVILAAMKGDKASPEDKALVARHLAPEAELTFVGRRLSTLDEIGKFNATRYKWVKKQMDRWDVTYEGPVTIVSGMGSLYGEWPDGVAFQGNRYLDRFVLVDGRIVKMDVWNDSAELIALRKTPGTPGVR